MVSVRAPEGIRDAVRLSRSVQDAGLTVLYLVPHHCFMGPGVVVEFEISFWTPEGTLWAEGTHETAESIHHHIDNWRDR